MKYFLTILMFQFTLSVIAQTNFSFHYNHGVDNFKKENYSDAIDDFTNALTYKKDS